MSTRKKYNNKKIQAKKKNKDKEEIQINTNTENCETRLDKRVDYSKGNSLSTERQKYVLELVNSWIVHADNKIVIMFSVLSAIWAIIAFLIETIITNTKQSEVNSFLFILTLVIGCFSVMSFIVSVIFFILCVIPRLTSDKTENKKDKDKKCKCNKKYSIFYEEIRDFELDDYIVACNNVTDEEFREEIIKEIYYNSSICSKKMKKAKTGSIISLISIILAFLAAAMYILALWI